MITMPVVKQIGKRLLVTLLSSQVRRLRRRHKFKVVAVAGSVGKTSTKAAIARLLGETRRVRWQEGNYNDPVTVPLIFFGHSEPHIFNIPAWLSILVKNELAMRRPFPYDVVVAELGTDTPGTVPQFAFIDPDIAVVTAVAMEHAAFFGGIDDIAKEELAVFDFARTIFVNIDDVDEKYVAGRKYHSYGLTKRAAYWANERETRGYVSQAITFHLPGGRSFRAEVPMLGEQGAKVALAAVAVGHELGLSDADIKKGLAAVRPFAGRMQLLRGIKNSILIDDTYNSNPKSAIAALDVLQSGDAPQRIAILGSMNELGAYSKEAHEQVGTHCDPRKLDAVITIGLDAKQFLAPVARTRGCEVHSFSGPYEAGKFVRSILQEGAVVLAKGSQNGVFAEEALKFLLADRKDVKKLVRQSPYWMRIKQKQFGGISAF